MIDSGESRAAHKDLLDQIKAALATAPARPRVTLPSPPRDGRGRYAAAQAADVPSNAPEQEG